MMDCTLTPDMLSTYLLSHQSTYVNKQDVPSLVHAIPSRLFAQNRL